MLAEQPARNREGLGVTEPRLAVPFWYFCKASPPPPLHFPACQPLLPVLPRLRSPGPLPARSPKCESLLPSPVSSAWEPPPTPAATPGFGVGIGVFVALAGKPKQEKLGGGVIDTCKGNFPCALRIIITAAVGLKPSSTCKKKGSLAPGKSWVWCFPVALFLCSRGF